MKMKTEFISIRVSPNVKEYLEERAMKLGLSISELIRMLVLKDIGR